MTDLLPCPFCGSAIAESKEYDNEHDCQVFCPECGCHGPLGAGSKQADDGWNRRHPTTEATPTAAKDD